MAEAQGTNSLSDANEGGRIPSEGESGSIATTGEEGQSWEHHVNIGVDSNDGDSGIDLFDDDDGTSITSASGSVSDFVEDSDGRRYHRYKQGKYIMPNDEQEQDRLNLQHHIWHMTLNQLSLAPLKEEPRHVLDIGTGTGLWAIEYAIEHPTSDVIGSDLSPIQPEFVPLNCTFEVSDLEDTWIYQQKFDLIHCRALCSCIGDPPHFFRQAFDSITPGGYLEMQDCDVPATSDEESYKDTPFAIWYDKMVEGCKALGRDVGITSKYKQWMIDTGFEDVEEKIFYWPLNTWPKDKKLKKIGFFFHQDFHTAIQSLKAPFVRGLGWSLEEIEKFQVEVLASFEDKSVHAYHICRVITGRKPETAP